MDYQHVLSYFCSIFGHISPPSYDKYTTCITHTNQVYSAKPYLSTKCYHNIKYNSITIPNNKNINSLKKVKTRNGKIVKGGIKKQKYWGVLRNQTFKNWSQQMEFQVGKKLKMQFIWSAQEKRCNNARIRLETLMTSTNQLKTKIKKLERLFIRQNWV